jgi:N4-gp56 family major capsid protein
MTMTAVAFGDAQAEQIWSSDAISLGMDRSFWVQNGFVGTDHNNVIINHTELKKGKGDTIYLPAIGELTGEGVIGDNPQEDEEEELPRYSRTMTIDQLRNAVRIEGAMTEQRTALPLRRKARDALSNWLGNKITEDTFDTLSSAPTRVVFGGDATTKGSIEAGDYLTTTIISKAVTIAGKITPEIRPLKREGTEVFVCIPSPDSAYDLRISDAVWGQATREAMPRGTKNPLFTNAFGKWNGTLIHPHKYVTTAADFGGAALAGSENLFVGQAAGAWAFAKDKFWKEKLFDYDNSPGVCIGVIWGVVKLVYDSEDIGLISLVTYRSNNVEAAYA